MHQTASDSLRKPKRFHYQFSIALSPLEKALLDYYAGRFGADRIAVVRGMLRKYAQMDTTFDPRMFKDWVDRHFLPNEPDENKRQLAKTQVSQVEKTLGLETTR